MRIRHICTLVIMVLTALMPIGIRAQELDCKVVINSQKIVNQTRFTAKPLIHIEGSGTVTVSIGGNTISASITDYINIDCETMNAYRLAAENKNSDISGSFPKIIPGENTVGITGTTTKVTIVPRYFTI